MLSSQRMNAGGSEADGTCRGFDGSSAADAPGSLASFAEIYDAHFDFIWRSVRRLGVSEGPAEDVVQEIFIHVHRRLGTFEGRSTLKTWLFGVALGVVRNHRRAAHRKRVAAPKTALAAHIDAADRSDEDQPYARAEKAEAVRILYRILDEMDDDKREVFVLAELEQLPASEIAQLLGSKLHTVYSRLRAAREQFKNSAARYRARDGWRYR